MQSVSKPLTNAEKLRRYNAGVATRLKQIEAAVEDLRADVRSVLEQRQLTDRQRKDPQQDARR